MRRGCLHGEAGDWAWLTLAELTWWEAAWCMAGLPFTLCTCGRTEASWRMQVGEVGDVLEGILGCWALLGHAEVAGRLAERRRQAVVLGPCMACAGLLVAGLFDVGSCKTVDNGP